MMVVEGTCFVWPYASAAVPVRVFDGREVWTAGMRKDAGSEKHSLIERLIRDIKGCGCVRCELQDN
jgi:hypothetical protein